jgi:hypothetical protein
MRNPRSADGLEAVSLHDLDRRNASRNTALKDDCIAGDNPNFAHFPVSLTGILSKIGILAHTCHPIYDRQLDKLFTVGPRFQPPKR